MYIMEKAKILEQLIKDSGYNLKSFAQKCNLPYTTLYSIIRNGVGRASVDNVMIICQNLGLSIEDLNQMAGGTSVCPPNQPGYKDLHQMIARNKEHLSIQEKMKLIKLLSELE